jgi:feruloyl esterase
MGSELAWSPWLIPPSPTGAQNSTIAWSIGNGWLKYLAYHPNPPLSFSVKNATFDDQTFRRAEQLSGFWNDTDTDLSAFRNAGGKLILYHGWADQAISPYGTVAYYAAISDQMGGLAATQRFARLFMFPGMNHCQGGDAPNTFDLLTELQNWVENGQAPSKVVASESDTSGNVIRTRPVYAYPLVARYDGSGSTDEAANFHPAQPTQHFVDRYRWLGSFEPHSDTGPHGASHRRASGV